MSSPYYQDFLQLIWALSTRDKIYERNVIHGET